MVSHWETHGLAVSLAIAGLLAAAGCSPDTSPPSADTVAPADAKSPQDSASQLIDATYLDNKYSASANAHCDVESNDYLRSIAKYDYAWDEDTKGWFGIKFDKYMGTVTAPGIIVLVSSKAKLQNGFGAFEHIDLYCSFDTQKDKVLSFSTDEPPAMVAAIAPSATATQAAAPSMPAPPITPQTADPLSAEYAPAPPPPSSADVVRSFYQALERGDPHSAAMMIAPDRREGAMSEAALAQFSAAMLRPINLDEVTSLASGSVFARYDFAYKGGKECTAASMLTLEDTAGATMIDSMKTNYSCSSD